MTDVTFAHILRPVRRNQPVIAFRTRDSVVKIIVGRTDHHEGPPCILLLSLAWKNKNIMTVISSNCWYCPVQQSAVLRISLGSRASPPWQHDDVEIISGVVKARRTPLVSPRLRVRRQATLATTHFCPELPARGCFLSLSDGAAWGEITGLSCLLMWMAASFAAWVLIALSQQHPTFSRPIWSRMAPRLQGGPLPRRHPPTPLRNAMSSPGTCPTRSSISLILN